MLRAKHKVAVSHSHYPEWYKEVVDNALQGFDDAENAAKPRRVVKRIPRR